MTAPVPHPASDNPTPRAGSGAGAPFRRVYLGLGSNDEPERHLAAAMAALASAGADLVLEAWSTAWQSAAVPTGQPPQQPQPPPLVPDYVNAVVQARTRWTQAELGHWLKQIEARLGRDRARPGSVPIDIDLLIDNGAPVEPALWDHGHRTVPLAELRAGLVHPVSHETLDQLARRHALEIAPLPRPDILNANRISEQAAS